MIIKQRQTWGELQYDTSSHRFDCIVKDDHHQLPFIQQPVVLNIDLTFKCNLNCLHCVARDMRRIVSDDLKVSKQLLKSINGSPFMVVVITGGEPLLPEYTESLGALILGIQNKGIVVDSNGTNPPSKKLLRLFRSRNVMVRISLDSFRPQDEMCLRGIFPPSGHATEHSKKLSVEAHKTKLATINSLRSAGIHVAIQSVLHKKNLISLKKVPEMLNKWGIDQLYIQRLIPTVALPNSTQGEDGYFLDGKRYEQALDDIEAECRKLGVECISKRDRRHNCVFLLVGDGDVFTQGEAPGEKIPLGRLEELNYFDFVSSSEHSWRYYGNAIDQRDEFDDGKRK